MSNQSIKSFLVLEEYVAQISWTSQKCSWQTRAVEQIENIFPYL